MTSYQKRTLWLLLVLGATCFILFAFPNATGAKDEHMLFVLSTDEHITYPYTLRMVTPGKDIFETLYRWIAYQDYHYGYPFYFISALVILPVRLIYGDLMTSYTQVSLFLLRQFVNVIPMAATITLLVYLQTRFTSRWRSAALFTFLATVPGIFRTNIQWWHPDSLALLAATLTLFFLDRDRLRFGKDFYIAAAACGLATGIKVFALFFFLAIGAYILAGLIKRQIDFKKAVIVGILFILVMGAALVISNPLLIPERTRTNILAMQAKIRAETTSGWADEDTYSTGLASWMPYLTRWYAQAYFLIFALLSTLAASLWGRQSFVNRLILAWILPYSFYLIAFIAVKPDHYWLPVMLPLMSGILSLFSLQRSFLPHWLQLAGFWRKAVPAVIIAIIASQAVLNLAADARLYNSAMIQEWMLYHNIHID